MLQHCTGELSRRARTLPALALALDALTQPDDLPDAALALAQLRRLAGSDGLAAQQGAALATVRQGLEEAAGLPLLAANPVVLAHHIAIRIPAPCDAATFYAYVLGEQTPVRWLPALREGWIHGPRQASDAVRPKHAPRTHLHQGSPCGARALALRVAGDDGRGRGRHSRSPP